jgi:hypothetical protein
MKKILQNSITIISEIGIFILGFLWYQNTKEIEPIITMIASGTFLLISILSFFFKENQIRPKIVFHHKQDFHSRSPNGYSPKNKPIVQYGIDDLIQFWELKWSYDLEIRNNSSVTAYEINIKYENIPQLTNINGKIGKIQPIKNDDIINFNFKVVKNIEGTHIEADKILEEAPNDFMKEMNIIAIYKDEHGKKFKTSYNWLLDTNTFK